MQIRTIAAGVPEVAYFDSRRQACARSYKNSSKTNAKKAEDTSGSARLGTYKALFLAKTASCYSSSLATIEQELEQKPCHC